MATPTNVNNTTSKIVRIQNDEKELLFQLREIYGNDYRKYFGCIRRGANIPISIRRIYKLLDERKAYRRISDYFHRERIAKKTKRSKSHGHNKSYHRSPTRHIIQEPQSIPTIQLDLEMIDEDDNIHQPSTNPTITNNNEDLNETNHRIDDDDAQTIQPSSSSSINLNHQPKRKLSLINNPQEQSINTSISQSSLLSIRSSIQKALRELDSVIISKSDIIPEEHNDEQQRSLIQKPNRSCHPNLDDIVRSLSNVVHQQQENVHLIINESSALLIDDTKQSENLTTQESIKQILERLNTLVDRGHSVYDKIENILSEF